MGNATCQLENNVKLLPQLSPVLVIWTSLSGLTAVLVAKLHDNGDQIVEPNCIGCRPKKPFPQNTMFQNRVLRRLDAKFVHEVANERPKARKK